MTGEDAAIPTEGGTIVQVHVIPNAKGYSVEYDVWRQEIKIRVKAQPRGGKANKDLTDFLSRFFSHPQIISGKTGRSKRIFVTNSWHETVEILTQLVEGEEDME